MKKITLFVLVLLVIATAAVYFFIPASQPFTSQASFACPQPALTRFITDKNKWLQWWPGKKLNDSNFEYKNVIYTVKKLQLDGFIVAVSDDKSTATGKFEITPGDENLSGLSFSTQFVFPANPFKRTAAYFESRHIKKNITGLLADIKKFFDREENVYGMKVERQKVTDTLLIAAKQLFTHYPGTAEIYEMINKLQQYIQQQGGKEQNAPMLNVYKESDTEYNVMVAIPTITALPSSGNILFKKMVPGYILVSKIKGGPGAVQKAEEEMHRYAIDYGKLSPAIPYQSLITNRSAEKDSSKWETKIYFPIFF